MTPEERTRLKELCILIQSEEDHGKVSGLVNELDELLEKSVASRKTHTRIHYSEPKA